MFGVTTVHVQKPNADKLKKSKSFGVLANALSKLNRQRARRRHSLSTESPRRIPGAGVSVEPPSLVASAGADNAPSQSSAKPAVRTVSIQSPQQQHAVAPSAASSASSETAPLIAKPARSSFALRPALVEIEHSPPAEQLSETHDKLPVLLTLCACMGSVLFGVHVGFSSPTERAVRDEAQLTPVQSSFLWSLVSIGGIIGSLLAGPLSNWYGRRPAILGSAVPYFVGGLLMVLWPEFVPLCVGRLICGVGVGLSSVLTPLYIAEISPAHLRGSLGSANQFMLAGGILLVNLLGLPIVTDPSWWKTLMLLSFVPLALLVVPMVLWGCETPRWLLSKGREEEALLVLQRLRGPDYDAEQELLESGYTEEVGVASLVPDETLEGLDQWGDITATPSPSPSPRVGVEVKAAAAAAASAPTSGSATPNYLSTASSPSPTHTPAALTASPSMRPQQPSTPRSHAAAAAAASKRSERARRREKRNAHKTGLQKLLSPPALRPFLLGVGLQLLQQWSGINAFMFFTTSLFESAAGSSSAPVAPPVDGQPLQPPSEAAYTPFFGAIAVNGVQVLMTGTAMMLMDRAGRKFWLITSCLGMFVVSAVMGWAYWLPDNAFPSLNFVRILLVMAYVCFFAVGLGPLPWLVGSELYLSSVRGLAMSVATVVNWTSAFVVTATFRLMQAALGACGVFWFYAGVALLGAAFVAALLPETRGKTLDQIERLFEDLADQKELAEEEREVDERVTA